MANENLNTGELAIALLKHFETCVLDAYDDNGKAAGGVWTIGWGSTHYKTSLPVKEGDRITQSEADDLLAHDLVKFEASTKKRIAIPLPQHQFGALVDFTYNTGGGYKDKNGIYHDYDLWHNINEGMPPADLKAYWERCAVTQAGVPLLGLRRRRAAQYYLFANGFNHPNFFADLK